MPTPNLYIFDDLATDQHRLLLQSELFREYIQEHATAFVPTPLPVPRTLSPSILLAVYYFPALQPPSIRKAVPVTKADSSLARYRAAAAISSGVPILPSACVEAISR